MEPGSGNREGKREISKRLGQHDPAGDKLERKIRRATLRKSFLAMSQKPRGKAYNDARSARKGQILYTGGEETLHIVATRKDLKNKCQV